MSHLHEFNEKTIKWDLYFLGIAQAVAKGSKCVKRQVGSVIIDKDRRICSTGMNGRPRQTCDKYECLRLNIPSGENLSVRCCLCSELNCLLYADFSEIQGGTIFVTHAPCDYCAMAILQTGLSALVFLGDHRRQGIEYIEKVTAEDPRLTMREYDLEKNTVNTYSGGNWSLTLAVGKV